MEYKYRFLQEKLASPPEHFGSVLITGPRRAGKTTLAKHLLKLWGGDPERSYYSFDTPDEIAKFQRDPELFFQSLELPVIFDEIQNIPDLIPYVKSALDKRPKGSCQFILTGSQQFQLMNKVTESLAGRVLIKELFPFSSAEISGIDSGLFRKNWLQLLTKNMFSFKSTPVKKNEVFDSLLRGGFPPIQNIQNSEDRRDWFQSYLQTYIQRDIRELGNVSDLGQFHRFISLLSGRSSHILNYSELGKDIGVNYKTTQRWTSLLESTYLWKNLSPFSSNSESRISKRPKGIMMDSGLLCYLTGIYSEDSLENTPLIGHIFESFVISELLKTFSFLNLPIQCFHFRSSTKKEVDFIADLGNEIIPFEIKFTSSISDKHGDGIKAFMKHLPNKNIRKGYVISLHPEFAEIQKNIFSLPLGTLINMK